MAPSWGVVVSEQADLIATRIRQLISSVLHFLHDELGVDLGLKPELYPAWAVFSAALIGLFLLLVLFAACSGARRRKQGASRSKNTAALGATENARVAPVKAPKPDEPKKKPRKKPAEKKNQSNGAKAPEPREPVKLVKEIPKQTAPSPTSPPPPPPPAAAPPRQPEAIDTKAAKAKKSKKKPKPEVKPTQSVSSTDGKEPEEGAWETKISNREKRQQRKKEKGSNDESGSPGVGQHVGQHVGQRTEQPAGTAPVNTKKNKESLNVKAVKGDGIATPVQATWSSVSSAGWTDLSVKLAPQGSVSDREKSSTGIKTSGHRTSETFAWAQESEAGSWPSMDRRIKPEVNRMNHSVPRLNPSAAGVAAELRNGPTNADEWSGFNGLGGIDPSSDWNAPTELWGNYDEPKPRIPAAQEAPISQVQESDDDKDKGDPSGSVKSKRKKKKKKKPEDENAGSQVATESSTAPAESGYVKPRPHVPVEEPTKQIVTPQSGQKKSDQNLEPLKQVQKKKARRET